MLLGKKEDKRDEEMGAGFHRRDWSGCRVEIQQYSPHCASLKIQTPQSLSLERSQDAIWSEARGSQKPTRASPRARRGGLIRDLVGLGIGGYGPRLWGAG